jgi:hypothetical protein
LGFTGHVTSEEMKGLFCLKLGDTHHVAIAVSQMMNHEMEWGTQCPMYILLRSWLVVWTMNFIFNNIWDVILPIDVHMFQDG